MSWWRASAAVACIVVALLVGAAPAVALERPTIVIASPHEGQTLGSAHISGTAEMSNGLNSILELRIDVRPTGRGAPSRCMNEECGADLGTRATSFSFSPSLPYNGPYEATVTAVGKDVLNLLGAPDEAGIAKRRLKVEAKPAAPRNVKADVNADRSVTVSWSRNSEPDLIGYQVQRRSSGSAFTTVDSVSQPAGGSSVSLTDRAPVDTGGAFEYIVIAARPDGDGGTRNPVSAASAPTPPVSVPGPDGVPPPGPSPPTGSLSKDAVAPTSLHVSQFLSKAGGSQPPTVAVPSVSPPSGGFSSTLPLQVPDAEPSNEDVAAGEGEEVAIDDDAVTNQRRAVLIPIAAGLVLWLAAAHLRALTRRVVRSPGNSQLPVWSGDDRDPGAAAGAVVSVGTGSSRGDVTSPRRLDPMEALPHE